MSYNIGLDYAQKMIGVNNTSFTREEKTLRKHTIKQLEFMKMRDTVLGIRPTSPPLVIHHPRAFDPPLSCRDGHHQWETGMLMGIPRLKCKKCGHIVFEGSYNGTETKREIRERFVPKPPPVEPNFTVTRIDP